jgi:hypothetical protein
MTVLDKTQTQEQTLVLPGLGTVIERKPSEAARALQEVRSLEEKLREAKRLLTEVIVEESARLGARTLRFGDIEVEVKGGEEIEWDVGELLNLVRRGLPQERYEQLVKVQVTYKVSASEAKRIASSNPLYAEIIERAKSRKPAPYYVAVRRTRA